MCLESPQTPNSESEVISPIYMANGSMGRTKLEQGSQWLTAFLMPSVKILKRDLSGSPVVKTPCFLGEGTGS